MMKQVKWGRVLVAGIWAPMMAFIVLVVVIGVYAGILGFQARGAPDNATISRFANQMGTYLAPMLTRLMTVVTARWATRKLGQEAARQGLAVGLVAAVITLALSVSQGV